ncbi:MAG: peptide/nickel transport system substrate-binding protein [Gaiellales bacterium]|nr:peptide/nickel transport system substrate-binding protein [Gaiellales bacterium]
MHAPSAIAGPRSRRRAAVRALRRALPIGALALVAAGCGSSLGGRYDSPTTAPGAVRSAGTTASTLRVVTAQPLPSLDPAFATTRQSRAVANALCTPLVRYADAEGLPGTVIVPGLARDLPVVSRGSRTLRIQLLSGLRFSDGSALTAQDVKATFERLLDPATGSPGATLFNEILGTKTFRSGEDRHLRGIRARGGMITISLKRSDPAFLARLAMPIACPVPAGTAHREVPALLARHSTGRYRVVESSSSVIDLARVKRATAAPNGGAPGAAAAISITRLGDAGALQEAVRSGSADLSLDDLPVTSRPALAVPSSALAILRVDPARWPLSDERVRRALSLALDREVLALSDGGDVVPARSLLLDPQAPGAVPADPATARALLRAAGAEGTLQLTLWAEPGTQERVARAIASQFAGIGVKVDVRVAPPGQRPAGARAWLEWLDSAYGDPAAIFVPLADALPTTSQGEIAKRVRRTARLAGDARRAAFRRLDERLGGGGLGAIPLLRANFSTPISSMLVGRGTHPVFDVDLALLSTRP